MCARHNLTDRCKPNYGGCIDGKRSVPIELLDVAGLVPGAHEGKGLGNKFLDDLRHADALIHVVDVSGTTDAEGTGSLVWKDLWNIDVDSGSCIQGRRHEGMTHLKILYG